MSGSSIKKSQRSISTPNEGIKNFMLYNHSDVNNFTDYNDVSFCIFYHTFRWYCINKMQPYPLRSEVKNCIKIQRTPYTNLTKYEVRKQTNIKDFLREYSQSYKLSKVEVSGMFFIP